jgi:hypothetical protein
MPIFELKDDRIERLQETAFRDAGLTERYDLQRLLRQQIDVVAADVLIVAEEFGEWDKSRRRIDLLGVDHDANLVVFELKRTEDSGFMDLQAIRYAAMVSTMTFEKTVQVYEDHLRALGSEADARSGLLEFLGWDEPDEEHFAQDARVILVSADFSAELTTAVLWLNTHGLDIRCVRIKPYVSGDRILVDVQQVIPLPEAMEYTVQIRAKSDLQRLDREDKSDRSRIRIDFWTSLLGISNQRTQLFANRSPTADHWLSAGTGMSGMHLAYVILEHGSRVALSIVSTDADWNKRAFDALAAHKDAIEERFGAALEWRRNSDQKQSMIRAVLDTGGYRDQEDSWPETQEAMVDAMVRLEAAFRPHVDRLNA